MVSGVLRGVTGITVASFLRADVIISKSSTVQQPYYTHNNEQH